MEQWLDKNSEFYNFAKMMWQENCRERSDLNEEQYEWATYFSKHEKFLRETYTEKGMEWIHTLTQ